MQRAMSLWTQKNQPRGHSSSSTLTAMSKKPTPPLHEHPSQHEKHILANIQRLTQLCGEYVHGIWATYDTLDHDALYSIGRWNTPTQYQEKRAAHGAPSSDIITDNKSTALLIRNLAQTGYAATDPFIQEFQLVTYFGRAVQTATTCFGCLSIVFQHDFVPTTSEQQVLELCISAIRAEEELRARVRTHRPIMADAESIAASQQDLLPRFVNPIFQRPSQSRRTFPVEIIATPNRFTADNLHHSTSEDPHGQSIS